MVLRGQACTQLLWNWGCCSKWPAVASLCYLVSSTRQPSPGPSFYAPQTTDRPVKAIMESTQPSTASLTSRWLGRKTCSRQDNATMSTQYTNVLFLMKGEQTFRFPLIQLHKGWQHALWPHRCCTFSTWANTEAVFLRKLLTLSQSLGYIPERHSS